LGYPLSASASAGHEEIPPYLADDVRLGERLNVSLVGSYQVEGPEIRWRVATSRRQISSSPAIMDTWVATPVLHITDISQPQLMELVAQVEMPGPALDVKVDGDLAIVAVQHGGVNELGLVVVDGGDPPNAKVVSMVQDEFWSGVHNTFLEGDRAYLAHSTSRGFTVVDLSIPDQPRISGTWINELSGTASIIHDVFVDGGLAFLSDLPRGSGGLVILDLLDPDQP